MAETETTQQKPAATAPPSRTAAEIMADSSVAEAVKRLGDLVLDAREFAGEITLIVDADRIVEVACAFKAAGYKYLVDLTVVDYSKYPNYKGERYGIVYTLYSFEKNRRVRLRGYTSEGVAIPSVTGVWKNANWHEREAFDMFGIPFKNHPNLERILMWEGFNGYPLRKDFPLRGIDTGARIYPEVFEAGQGPKEGSTGKDGKDIHFYSGDWTALGISPPAQIPVKKAAPVAQLAPATEVRAKAAEPKVAAPTPPPLPVHDAPWHNSDLGLSERMDLAKGRTLGEKLFAAMAQTDCAACGYDCEGYGVAIGKGEEKDVTLCVPGGAETETTIKNLLAEAVTK